MPLLITGSMGVLGKEIKKLFPESITPSHKELDIIDRSKVFDFVKDNQIKQIIHTAAITSVRKCEDSKQEAWNANVEGTKNLVDALKEYHGEGSFFYISTACVFRGDGEMYTESSIPNPVNFYALTKLVGESIVRTYPHHLIIRTNFVTREKWPYDKAFVDRFGTYLFPDDVAKGIKELYNSKQQGLIHLTGTKVFSMYEIAKNTTPNVERLTLKEYSGPHLTVNMTLDSVRWKKYEISN